MDETDYYFSFLLITIKEKTREVARTRCGSVFSLRIPDLKVQKHGWGSAAGDFPHRPSTAHNSKNNWNAQTNKETIDNERYPVLFCDQ